MTMDSLDQMIRTALDPRSDERADERAEDQARDERAAWGEILARPARGESSWEPFIPAQARPHRGRRGNGHNRKARERV